LFAQRPELIKSLDQPSQDKGEWLATSLQQANQHSNSVVAGAWRQRFRTVK
jgi:hypothetical protein